MVLLTQAEAQQAIDNLLNALAVGSRQWGKIPKSGTAKRAGKTYAGAAQDLVDIVNRAIDEYGVIFVGSVMERARRFVDDKDPRLYYESRDTEIIDEQEFTIENFDNAIRKLIDELLSQLELEEREREEDERRKQQKPTKEKLEADYRKARRQLQQLVRRRAKKGVDVSNVKIPSIPKKITAGSIRRLSKEIEKVKQIR